MASHLIQEDRLLSLLIDRAVIGPELARQLDEVPHSVFVFGVRRLGDVRLRPVFLLHFRELGDLFVEAKFGDRPLRLEVFLFFRRLERLLDVLVHVVGRPLLLHSFLDYFLGISVHRHSLREIIVRSVLFD